MEKPSSMNPSNENALVQSLKKGHEAGFQELYGSYGGKIYHLAYWITGNREDAEDIVQETLLQVFRHIDEFDGRSRFYSWIYTIAKNIGLRAVQKQKKRSFDALAGLIAGAQDPATPADLTPLEIHDLTRQIKEGCLTGLLGCLSFSQRAAFVLHVLVNLSIKDTAAVLEKSEPAVKVLIHRARENLKAFLCRHCSLYNPGNPCRCRNLIGFSLKQGWIARTGQGLSTALDIMRMEQEIKKVRKVAELYHELPEPVLSEDLIRRIQAIIREDGLLIFNQKKE